MEVSYKAVLPMFLMVSFKSPNKKYGDGILTLILYLWNWRDVIISDISCVRIQYTMVITLNIMPL